MEVSQRIANLSASPTFAMLAKTQELKDQGIDIISLSVGEPDFNTPDNIKTAAHVAIDENYSHYSPVPGYADLRKAIAHKLFVENGLRYEPTQIVCTNGGKQAVAQTLLALVDEGDEVIIPAPYWVSYPEMVKLAHGKPVFVKTDMEHNFKLTPEQLRAAITSRTVALILCSPSNPTGAVYTHDELEALAEVLRRYPRVMVLSDEIYEHINYIGRHASIAQCAGMRDQTVVLNGCSKGYAMTGWRLGWLAGPQWLAAGVSKLQGQFSSGPCSVTQRAALEAYVGPQDSVRYMRSQFEKRRNLIYRLVQDIPGLKANEPEGAFYLWCDCHDLLGKGGIMTADDLAMYLLQEAHVATVAGTGFGAPGYLRMSYANSERNIEEAMSRIKAALAKLK